MNAPAHVERVVKRLREHRLNPRPHQIDKDRWDAYCPVCGGELVLRDVSWDEFGLRRVMLFCECDEEKIVGALALQDRSLYGQEEDADPEREPETLKLSSVTLKDFTDVQEEGARALLGTDETNAVIPEGGDIMFYGDGGAGKTTLAIDLAFHLAAGKEWLGIPVPRPVRVLLIENEGPRPLLRKKLRRKREAWTGGDLGDRIRVFDEPWGRFTFAIEIWRSELALEIAGQGIDMVIAGPLTRLGMDQAGTLQEIAAFMDLIGEVREICERPLTLGPVHHENKVHTVSGAWEGSGDTLLHVQSGGNGHTIVFLQKARWAPEHHDTTLKLAWAAGEGFEVEGERDLLAEVAQLLSDGKWRTAKEIATSGDKGGIGANLDTVRDLLGSNPDLFESRTGDAAKELGRHPSAVAWQVTRGPESPESGRDLAGGEGAGDSVTPPLRGVTSTESPPLPVQEVTRTPESPRLRPICSCADGGAEPTQDGRCSRCWGVVNQEEDMSVSELFERVSRYVEDHPDATAAEVAAELGAIRGAVDQVLLRLERFGFLERRGDRYRSLKPYRRAA